MENEQGVQVTVVKSPVAPTRPAWFRSMLSAFEAAESCAFMPHTCVTDYVRPGVSVVDYLSRTLSGPFQIVALYSVSDGLKFAQPHMRQAFHDVMGTQDENPEAPILMAPTPAAALLLAFLKKAPAQSAAVIFERIDNMVGEVVPIDPTVIELMEMLHNAGTDKELEQHGNPLIMLTPSLREVRAQVRTKSSGIKAIEIPMPDHAERLAFAKARLDEETDVVLDGITVEQLAALTAGLMRRHIENIILRARSEGGKLTRELASAVQRELMDTEYAGIVRRIDKTFKLDDMGGQSEFKAHAKNRVIKPLRDGRYDLAPNAVLLVGPPGTGKTMGAAAVANESGLNCLEVDLSALMGGIVGQTEGNIALFDQAIAANVPTVIVCDEIDQKVRRGEGGPDSGGGGAVENRLFAAILELIEKYKGKGVTWYFMSNRPDLLDSAFLSRMQAVIPMLPAEDDGARADVLGRIINRLSPGAAQGLDLMPLASQVENWSGRDLEQVASEAIASAALDGNGLADALADTIKWRRADVTSVKKQVTAAINACKDLRLVPEKYRTQATAAPAPADWHEGEQPRKARKLTWDN